MPSTSCLLPRAVAVVLAALVLAAPPAGGHGAWYPPPERGAGDGPQGGPTTPGPQTPGPKASGPETGPPLRLPPGPGTGEGWGPSTGGSPPPGGVARTGGGGRKRRASSTSDGWEVWWEHNKDPYLRRAARPLAPSGNAAFLTGRGARVEDGIAALPVPAVVRGEVVPALVRALSAPDPELLDSATIALGRVAQPEDEDVAAALRLQLQSRHATVRQSGLLALGILGDRSAAPLLWQVMSDTSAGRDALGGGSTAVERAFAAFALGFSCGPEMVPQIVRLLERTRGDDVEVSAGAVLALGLVPEAASESIPVLVARLDDRSLDRRVRAQVPIALGRIGEPAAPVVPRLLELAADRRADDDLRRSSVIALGRLSRAEDAEVVARLRRIVREENDAPLRRFALIALGRLLGRSEGADSGEAVFDLLALELADPSSAADRPFAALALGVAAHGHEPSSALRGRVARELESSLRHTRNPHEVGAAAIALGLAGASDTGPDLLARFLETSDAALRSRLAVALGLLGHRAAAPTLAKALRDTNDAALQVELATALRLLGDGGAAARLVTLVSEADSFAVASAAGRALGQVGGRDAIDPLLALLDDRSRPEPVRAIAAVALGLIAEKTDEPWNAPLSVDSNYLTGLGVQRSILDIH